MTHITSAKDVDTTLTPEGDIAPGVDFPVFKRV